MIDLSKIKIDFEGGSIVIPGTVHGIIYEDFIDKFRVYESKWIEDDNKNRYTPYDEAYEASISVREKEKLLKKIRNHTLSDEQIEGIKKARLHLIDAVSSLVEGDLSLLPFVIDETKTPSKDFIFDLETVGQEVSILSIYTHLVNVIESYSVDLPHEGKVMTINGESYFFSAGDFNSLSDISFTVGESVTALAFRSELSKNKMKGYDGNIDFSLSLREVAILCRKKDEVLPYKVKEMSSWIDNRVKLFRDNKITLGDVLKIRFFFLAGIKLSMTADYTNGFLRPHTVTQKIQMIKTQRNGK